MAFGHNKLWQPPPVNSISVTLRSYPYAAALTMVEALLVTKGHNISSVKDLWWVCITRLIMHCHCEEEARTYICHLLLLLLLNWWSHGIINQSLLTHLLYNCFVYDEKNVVAFGHNKLWQPPAVNSLKMVWPLNTTNCVSLQPWIASL